MSYFRRRSKDQPKRHNLMVAGKRYDKKKLFKDLGNNESLPVCSSESTPRNVQNSFESRGNQTRQDSGQVLSLNQRPTSCASCNTVNARRTASINHISAHSKQLVKLFLAQTTLSLWGRLVNYERELCSNNNSGHRDHIADNSIEVAFRTKPRYMLRFSI